MREVAGGLALREEVDLGSGARVLLVEDDSAIATMYRVVLEMKGHAVTVAADGRAGLEVARSGEFDLVLLDIQLPGMDGIAVLEALRSDLKTGSVPVVMLTNFGDPLLREQAFALGARDYLLKSKTMPRDLAAQIRGWATSRRRKTMSSGAGPPLAPLEGASGLLD